MAVTRNPLMVPSMYAYISTHSNSKITEFRLKTSLDTLYSLRKGVKVSDRFIAMASDSNNSVASSPDGGIKINGGGDRMWYGGVKVEGGGGGGGGEEESMNLLLLLHEGARAFQAAMEKNESAKGSWLAKRWTGFDRKAWLKLLSYQVSVYSLLQAAMEIAMRGEGRDRDIHVFVQRSLSHQCGPLEDSIKQLLSSRDPQAAEWLWSQELPFIVSGFVNILERDSDYVAVTSTNRTTCPNKESDVALLMLTISGCAAAMKLGPATLSCPAFSTRLVDEIGRLMNMLADFVPISNVYAFSCKLGLRREFLANFGSRVWQVGGDERSFWVDVVEQLLRSAIIREGVRSKLRCYDTVEALEKDLSVFGFFAALGRSARTYLSARQDSPLSDPLAGLLRYLEGGSVLFYPQLSTLTFYQLFVEVVCEEMEWLTIFPNDTSSCIANNEVAVCTVLTVCSRWITDFLSYSQWVDQPGGSRALDFLFKSHLRLVDCLDHKSNAATRSEGTVDEMHTQLKLFEEDFERMEGALCKLESLLSKCELAELPREHIQRIRRLKKESSSSSSSSRQASSVTVDATCLVSVNGSAEAYTDVFSKSIEKLKDASADLWRGTQLLGTDVAAATVLLQKGALGGQLTEREKKTLKRTFTDLASVIPIGFLMLLPVTAVGHAAILAAIQKYVPALIPSAYAPERLDLLRQLEKVQQLEKKDVT